MYCWDNIEFVCIVFSKLEILECMEKNVKLTTSNDDFSDTNNQRERLEKLKKTFIVVGASSGIGFETALRLLGKGFSVVNISRTPCSLKQVKNYKADVAAGESLENVINQIHEEFDWIYGLVYCAGFSMAAPIEYASELDYRYLFEVNYFGALRAIKSCIPILKKRGGRIVIVSSMGGLFPIAFDSFYSSSKAAVDMLVKSAAIELEPYNIKVSTLQPGGTSTGFTFKRKIYDDEETGDYSNKIKRATAALAELEQRGMSAGEVAREIVETLCEKRPPLVKQCGGWNKFYAAAGKILPEKTTHFINRKIYKQ